MISFDDYMIQIKNTLSSFQRSSIISASYDITNLCNLSCEHCYNKLTARDLVNDEIQDKNSVIIHLKSLGVVDLVLCGGEPFMYPGILSMIRLAKIQGMRLTILTNGTLLSEDIIHELSECLTSSDIIQISVDDDLFCYKANYQRHESRVQKETILKSIQGLTNFALTSVINITPTSINVNYIYNIVDSLVNIGVKNISFTPYVPLGGSSADYLIPDPATLIKLHNQMLEYADKKGFLYKNGLRGHPCQDLNLIDNNREANQSNAKNRQCDAARFNIHVCANGNIYPCVFMVHPDWLIGNINERVESITEFATKTNFAIKKELPVKCQSCEIIRLCNGGCIGLVYDRYQSLYEIDPRCKR